MIEESRDPAACRTRAEAFSLERTVEAYLELYAERAAAFDFAICSHTLEDVVQVPHAAWAASPPAEHVHAILWTGEIPRTERIFTDPAAYDDYLREVVPDPPPRPRRRRRRLIGR